jgi:membrane protein YdbS with pleckstrin-like domain
VQGAPAQPIGNPAFGPPPTASTAGVFPREYLAAGESILYETKPSIFAFISLVTFIVLIVLFLVINAFAAAAGTLGLALFYASGDGGWILFLFVILPVLGLIGGVMRWWASAYAISNRRAMMSRGILSRNVADCTFDKIQNVNLHQGIIARPFGYGTIIYQTAGIMSQRERTVLRSGGVVWTGVKDPITTRRYMNEVTEYFRQQQKVQEFQQMASVLRSSGVLTTGAAPPPRPPVTSLPPTPSAARFCSSCGAPLAAGVRFCAACGKPTG